jgi:hypothetical protein
VAVLADAEVPETEGEEILLPEVLHRVELVVAAPLALQVLRTVRDREEERAVVIEVLRVRFRR